MIFIFYSIKCVMEKEISDEIRVVKLTKSYRFKDDCKWEEDNSKRLKWNYAKLTG